ncbi:hypothetical protein ABW19_dt0209403 [Dactylella cylindrospora]|nr:hypothetical protein ABW19_dt0209403 [Dactylella cylindrospora]
MSDPFVTFTERTNLVQGNVNPDATGYIVGRDVDEDGTVTYWQQQLVTGNLGKVIPINFSWSSDEDPAPLSDDTPFFLLANGGDLYLFLNICPPEFDYTLRSAKFGTFEIDRIQHRDRQLQEGVFDEWTAFSGRGKMYAICTDDYSYIVGDVLGLTSRFTDTKLGVDHVVGGLAIANSAPVVLMTPPYDGSDPDSYILWWPSNPDSATIFSYDRSYTIQNLVSFDDYTLWTGKADKGPFIASVKVESSMSESYVTYTWLSDEVVGIATTGFKAADGKVVYATADGAVYKFDLFHQKSTPLGVDISTVVDPGSVGQFWLDDSLVYVIGQEGGGAAWAI